MNLDEYLRLDRVSRSSILSFRESPERYRAIRDGELPPKAPTPAMLFGTMVDEFLTLGEIPSPTIPDDVVICPDALLGKNGAKSTKAYREFAAEHAGKKIWTGKDVAKWEEAATANTQTLFRIRDQIVAHERASQLVYSSKAEYQRTLLFTLLGTACKARPDIVHPGCIVDLKCSAHVHADWVAKQSVTFGYDVQAYMSRIGLGDDLPFLLLVIRDSPPHEVEVYELSDAFLARGQRITHETIEAMAEAERTGRYRSHTHGRITTIEPPRWAAYQEEYLIA